MTVNDFITILIVSILIIIAIIIEIIANKKFEQEMKHLVEENTKTQEKIRELTDYNKQLTKSRKG